MAASFEVGDQFPIFFNLLVDGVATDGTVVLTVTDPLGVATLPAVTNTGVGAYRADYVPTLNGLHTYRWSSTGAAVAAESDTFMVGHAYVSMAELKESLGITHDNDDALLYRAIDAASAAIDRMTGTHFGVAVTPTTRVFVPINGYQVYVDPFTDTTGLVVKTGTDGTYPTTVTAGDVTPWPYNASAKGDAYVRLDVANGGLPSAHRPSVQVTARWGWATVPDDIVEACRLKAARLYRRKDSPEGIAGNGEFGVVRISKYEDPDVLLLLAPFKSSWGVA